MERFAFRQAAPGAYRAMLGLSSYLHKSNLEQPLIHLVYLRVSQINGCAYCIDMHWKDLRALGEDEERLYMLNAWRESSKYSPRERAALLWAERVTRVAEDQVPDEVFEQVRPYFTDEEMVNLTLAVVAINGWNRLSISFRAEPGVYQSTLSAMVSG